MNKLIIAGVTALTLSISTAALAKTKIGMITTLSGGGSSLGKDVRDGFKLALKMSDNKDVELLIEDDGRKPAKAVQIADKFIQKEKVDILTGIIFSNLAMAVIPSTVKKDIFYISPNAGPSKLAGKGCHKNAFNVAWQNDNLHEAMGKYATDKGFKKSYILAPNYPAGKDALTGYKRFYKGEVADEIYTKLGQKDYAVEIAKIKASGADSVFFFLPGGMGIAFMKQYSQSGSKIPVMGPAFSFDQGILKAVGEAALGVKNSSQWNKDIDNEANKTFVAAYQKEYSRLPSLYASQGYDAANLILSALKKSPVSDKDAFRKALKAADFASPRGDFKFGNNNFPIQDIYVREVVKEGDVLTNKIISKAFEDHQDAYAKDCAL
ncbi:MAG TPA: ABC transporter substrate-binding protein [Leucothrix sp.]|nr:ABC transporter substrate-binding protein [Leucothrix sp.]